MALAYWMRSGLRARPHGSRFWSRAAIGLSGRRRRGRQRSVATQARDMTLIAQLSLGRRASHRAETQLNQWWLEKIGFGGRVPLIRGEGSRAIRLRAANAINRAAAAIERVRRAREVKGDQYQRSESCADPKVPRRVPRLDEEHRTKMAGGIRRRRLPAGL